MKITFTYIILLLVTLMIFSCREVYYPDDLQSDENIPVIQGIIMEGQYPRVQLYWAVKYDSSDIRFISGAEIFITDDQGSVAQLFENMPGTYYGWDIVGTAGHTYTLGVVLPDGREYQSTPQFLQPAPQIDSIYARPGKHTSYKYGASGKPVYTEEQGLYINTDLSSDFNNTLYYRFQTHVVKETMYTVLLNTPASYSIFEWETINMEESHVVDYTVTQNNRQVLFRHPVGFLRYYYDAALATPDQTAPYTIAWIVTQNVYSISPDVFQYYNSVGRQLNGNDQIFSPVASQVKGNIHCISDPTEKVIGVFEASSITTVYKAFSWKTLTSYKYIELPYFPEVGTGSSDRFPPGFWISTF
jgi:hypothetical protein